jgi:hypothetical protein
MVASGRESHRLIELNGVIHGSDYNLATTFRNATKNLKNSLIASTFTLQALYQALGTIDLPLDIPVHAESINALD